MTSVRFRAVLGVLLASMFVAVLPAGASTSSTPPVSTALAGLDVNGTWLGSYQLSNGAGPVYAVNPTVGYATGNYSSGTGQPLSAAAYEVGYLIGKYGASSGSNLQAELDAEISLHLDSSNASAAYNLLSGAQQSAATTLWNEAVSHSGPYSVSLRTPVSVHQGTQEPASVLVTSNSGNPVSGALVSLAGTNVTGSVSAVTTGSDGTASFTFSVPANATGSTYTLRASTQASGGINVYSPVGAGSRPTVVGASSPTTYSATVTAAFSTSHDVTLEAYRSTDGAKTPLAGAVFELENSQGAVLSTVTTQGAPVSLGNLSEGSTYLLVETSPAAGTYVDATPHSFTVLTSSSTQLVQIALPSAPNVSIGISASSSSVGLGSKVTGTVTLSGNDGESGTATLTLYGPVAAQNCASISEAAWLAAPKVSGQLAVSANGAYSLSSPSLDGSGCYAWGGEVVLVPSHVTASVSPGSGALFNVQKPASPTTSTTQPRPVTTTTRAHHHPTTTTTRPRPVTTTTAHRRPVTPTTRPHPVTTTTQHHQPSTTTTPVTVAPSPVVTTTPGPTSGGGGNNSQMILLIIFLAIVLILLLDLWRRRDERRRNGR